MGMGQDICTTIYFTTSIGLRDDNLLFVHTTRELNKTRAITGHA